MTKENYCKFGTCTFLNFTQLRSLIGVYAKHAPANRSRSRSFMLATGSFFSQMSESYFCVDYFIRN